MLIPPAVFLRKKLWGKSDCQIDPETQHLVCLIAGPLLIRTYGLMLWPPLTSVPSTQTRKLMMPDTLQEASIYGFTTINKYGIDNQTCYHRSD